MSEISNFQKVQVSRRVSTSQESAGQIRLNKETLKPLKHIITETVIHESKESGARF